MSRLIVCRWRHLVPMLKDKVSMWIPELPGYGLSSLPPKADKRTVGNILMAAFQVVFGKTRAVMWCGHDRGGRIGHRLLVDDNPDHNIKAAILMDIVPTLEQWRAFANPAAATAYYHWPFLATPMAPHLIELMGGYNYCKDNFDRIKGGNQLGVDLLKSDDAIDHYCHLQSKPETISGCCADYAAGAGEDVKEQERDQKKSKKVKAPLMIIYSLGNLGRMHDVERVWRGWVDSNAEFKCVGIGEGYGHFLPEECPNDVAKLVEEWVGRYGK